MTTDIARDEAVPPRESMASEVRRVAAAATLPHSYVVRGDALEFGASLGNAHCWLTTHGNGSIQDVFSTDLGQAIAHTIAVRYGGTGHHLLRASAQAVTTSPEAADVQLRPGAPGTIELHPAYQRHSFALPENLQVQETVFVPHATGDDPAVAYYQVEVTNASAAAQTVRVYAFGRLGGALGHLEGDFSDKWLEDIPELAKYPAMRQMTVGTPAWYELFAQFNQCKEFREQIKPFNFVTRFEALKQEDIPSRCVETGNAYKWYGVSTCAPLTRDIEKIGSRKKEDDGEDVFWADKGMVRYLRDKPTYDVKAADVYDGPIVSLANRLRFLVEETGLDKRTINRIKSGDVAPTPEHVELLQHAVQVWVENWSVRIKDGKGVVIAELCCDRLRESGRLVVENGRKIVKVNMNVSLWRRSRVKKAMNDKDMDIPMKWTAFWMAHYGQPITVQGLGKIKNDKSIPKDETVIALEKCFKRWESMTPEQREADYDRLGVRYKKGDSAE